MTPRILFVPVSGAGGAGEFMRSLIIARAMREQFPEADIHFIVNAEAGYSQNLEFPGTVIQGSPTFNIAAVNEMLARVRPHVVVFDSSGRVAQYRYARAIGTRVVYVSSRFKARWKGFRVRRMRYFDQHWIAQPRFLGGDLTRWERLKMALVGRVEPVFLETVFERPQAQRQARLLASLGIERNRFIVFCIGSGGSYAGVNDAPATVLAAAIRIRTATGLPCIVITGPNAKAPSTPPDGVHTIAALSNGELMDLMSAAHVAVVNGGSLLLQVIANRVPAVAVPVAGDQSERIKKCAALGLVIPCGLEAATVERHIVELVNDDSMRERMRTAMESLDLQNGATAAVDALVRLMEQRRTE